jgi:peptidyl-prolyl cis-trans isomerase SurA
LLRHFLLWHSSSSRSAARTRSRSDLGSVGLVCLVCVVALATATAPARAQREIESIAAQVGNEIILFSEVNELSGPLEERMRIAGAPPSEIQMVRREALERLIEGRLLSSVVDRLELGADREEIDTAISAIAQENGLTLDQLLASIESHGLAIEEYREKIRGEIERSKVVNAMVRSRVQISDEEVQALFEEEFGEQRGGGEEVYIRHILVMTEGPQTRTIGEACEVVRQSRSIIQSGQAAFSDVAQRVSDMNPQRGGDLGWMHQEDLAGWMSSTIRALQPGEISEVVEMPFGCNLLQLVDRREFQPIAFADAESRLRNVIFQRKTEVEYTKWLDVLREQTYIERKGAFAGAVGG